MWHCHNQGFSVVGELGGHPSRLNESLFNIQWDLLLYNFSKNVVIELPFKIHFIPTPSHLLNLKLSLHPSFSAGNMISYTTFMQSSKNRTPSLPSWDQMLAIQNNPILIWFSDTGTYCYFTGAMFFQWLTSSVFLFSVSVAVFSNKVQ